MSGYRHGQQKIAAVADSVDYQVLFRPGCDVGGCWPEVIDLSRLVSEDVRIKPDEFNLVLAPPPDLLYRLPNMSWQ